MAESILNSDAAYLLTNLIHPFRPEANIFNGAYISPLSPCPSHVGEPEKGLDLYETLTQPNNPAEVAQDYRPNFLENPYLGLGPFTPSIYYTDPLHILGIMDTFMRMSYGLGFMLAAKNFSPTIVPAVQGAESNNLEFTFLSRSAVNKPVAKNIFTENNIYPRMSEFPDKFMDSMILDTNPNTGERVISIRPSGVHYTDFDPIVNFFFDGETKYDSISMRGTDVSIFSPFLIESYREFIPQLRQAFIDLANFVATNLNNQRSEHSLGEDGGGFLQGGGEPADALETVGFFVADTPWAEDAPEWFPLNPFPGDEPQNLLVGAVGPIPILDTGNRGEAATTYKWTGANVRESLQVMWGDSSFHQRSDPKKAGAPWEYRSLHENLAVINVLPITLSDTMWSVALSESTPEGAIAIVDGVGLFIFISRVEHRHLTVVDFAIHTRVPQSIRFNWDCHTSEDARDETFIREARWASWACSLHWSYTNKLSFDPTWFDREIISDDNKTFESNVAFDHGARSDSRARTIREAFWNPLGFVTYGRNPGDQNRDFNLEDQLVVPDSGDLFSVRCRATLNTVQLSHADKSRQWDHEVSFTATGDGWSFNMDFEKVGMVLGQSVPD